MVLGKSPNDIVLLLIYVKRIESNIKQSQHCIYGIRNNAGESGTV